jgi:hypothetical protein
VPDFIAIAVVLMGVAFIAGTILWVSLLLARLLFDLGRKTAKWNPWNWNWQLTITMEDPPPADSPVPPAPSVGARRGS